MSDYHHRTDCIETTIIAVCPNADGSGDHLVVEATATESEPNAADVLAETLIGSLPVCGACGTAVEWIRLDTPVEVIN